MNFSAYLDAIEALVAARLAALSEGAIPVSPSAPESLHVLSRLRLSREARVNLDSCKEGQRLTITTFDRPLMVAAGAGSGKTFTLTRRIAYGLLAGEGKSGGLRSVDEVLAITFTVKAAAELRDRIRGLLREEGLVEESLKVDDAWVCTIGSMAARILRENAFEVGIDPAVRGGRRGGGELPSGRGRRAGSRPPRGRAPIRCCARLWKSSGSRAAALSTRGFLNTPRKWWPG